MNGNGGGVLGLGGHEEQRWSLLQPPDRMFELDPNCLVLQKPLNNEGGLGEVWYGQLIEPGKKHAVAVKKYPSAWGAEEVEMFRRETGVLFLAAMRCHNVCKVYGTTFKDGKLCIVMKLYKESMQGLMRRLPGGKMPLEDCRRYGKEICKAVAELHEQSIVLQDLKPPNILIDEYDHCVVADFGISKIVNGTLGAHMPSNLQGTFNYMSPESFDPEQFGGVTCRADSWSFACSLLEMLTGVKPWNGIKMAPIVRKVMAQETPDFPKDLVPPHVAAMIKQCFSFNPYHRPTFPQMLQVFQVPWTPQPGTGPSTYPGALPADIMNPISHLFDAFRRPASGSGQGYIQPPPRPMGKANHNREGMVNEDKITEAEKTISLLYQRASETDSLKNKLHELSGAHAKLERALEQRDQELAQARERSESAARKAWSEGEDNKRTLSEQIARLEKDKATLSAHLQKAADELRTLVKIRDDKNTQANKIRELDALVGQLRGNVVTHEGERKGWQKEHAARKAKIAELEKCLCEAEMKAAEGVATDSQLQNEKAKAAQLEKNLAAADIRYSLMARDLQQALSMSSELKGRLSGSTEEQKKTAQALEGLKSAHADAVNGRDAARQAIEAMQKSHADAVKGRDARIAELQTEVSAVRQTSADEVKGRAAELEKSARALAEAVRERDARAAEIK